MNFKKLLVGSKTGNLTCFIATSPEKFYGLSAFHVLRGSDNSVSDEEIVKIRNSQTSRWVQFGRTHDGRYYRGSAQYGDFGKLDYATFELMASFKPRIFNNIKKINLSEFLFFSDFNHIIGKKVFGYSVENNSWVSGEIKKIHHKVNDFKLFDVVIELDNSKFLYVGDSGMLWKDEKGNALFMHTDGIDSISNISFCTFINRITNQYHADIYELV